MRNLLALLIGIYFGIVLVKSEVSSWFRIQAMFRFDEAHMYLIMASAVVVGLASMQVIRRLRPRLQEGEAPLVKHKPFTKGTVLGGSLFGIGWSLTGACPGPIYAQIGKGDWMALVSLAGALIGAYLYALLRPRLPH